MLEDIPIYRLLLKPHSYLLENNLGTNILDLLEQLPNSSNVNHLSNVRGLDDHQLKKYYQSQLLLETKQYCRTLLEESKGITDEYNEILRGKDLDKIFQIIINNQLPFLKILILEDLKTYKLFKGRLQNEIKQASEINMIIKTLRQYGSYSKLA